LTQRLGALRDESVRHLVFSSSAAVYGVPEETPIREGHPTRPINPYGETKLAVERALPHYERAYGLAAIRLRYFNASGADPDGTLGEDHRPEHHAIPRAIAAARGGPRFEVYGADYATPDGTCLRDYVHVSDLADGRLRPLYGGRSAAQIYAENVLGESGAKPVAEAFVADRQWLDSNRDAVDALLGLWEVGLQNWTLQKEAILPSYPHLLSVQTDAEIAWVVDYVRSNDWVLPSVYLTQEDSEIQTGIFARMQSLGLLPDNAREPELDLSFPAAS